MNRLSIISDSLDRAGYVSTQLAGIFETHCLHRDGIRDVEPRTYTIVDINLRDKSHLSDIRVWLKLRPKNGKVIFAVEPGARQEAIQAFAIGATDLMPRPIDGKMLVTKLLGDIGPLAGDFSDSSIGNSPGISAGIAVLQGIFASACLGAPLDPKMIETAGESVIAHIEAEGIVSWIDSVRKHHSQTYQHCLLVTALAVTFGQQLGFSSLDQQRLAFAGLLHDIGKARIPITLLEKPGPLDDDELAVMRQHPLLGFEAIRTVPGLHPEDARYGSASPRIR